MADWSSQNITLTAKGASALSKVQAGSGSLTITKVVASEQYVAESTLREVTSLSVENLPLTIIDRHEVQDGGSVIQVQLSNLYLGKAFTLNEIGVFATHSDNPSEEFLYIIAQVDAETGDKIPLYATTPVTATYDIYLYNVGADNIEITISSAGLVTYEALNKACDIIQRNTAYEVGDIQHSHSLKKGLSIKCTVAGTTKSTDTDLSHKNVGDTVEDGTSQWVVIAPSTTADFDAHNHSVDAHPELMRRFIESGVNVIQRSHVYAKGDIAYSNKIPSWAFLECTVAGTTSDGWHFPEPSEIKVNDAIVDGTVTWKVRKVGSGEGVWEYNEADSSIYPKDTDDLTSEDLDTEEETLKEIVASVVDEKLEYIPVGTVIPFSGNGAIPNGYLLCNGAAVGRSAYSKLFEAIGTTYGVGDGFSTFNLPDLTDKFIEGSTTAGTIKAAGLPNITGNIYEIVFNSPNAAKKTSGAFKTERIGSLNLQGASDAYLQPDTDISFDASRSNTIYGASDTVQPPALTMRYIIKAFNGMTHESALIDITQYGQELANRANRDFSNITALAKSVIKGVVIVDQLLEQNGYVVFPNGLILQWGNSSSPVTFPIAFSNKALNVVATLQLDGDGGNMSKNRLYIQTLTTTGFTIQNPQGTYRYYAVGY